MCSVYKAFSTYTLVRKSVRSLLLHISSSSKKAATLEELKLPGWMADTLEICWLCLPKVPVGASVTGDASGPVMYVCVHAYKLGVRMTVGNKTASI